MDNDLIHISEKYLIQQNFFFMYEQCQKKLSIIIKIKHFSEKNACLYFKQIKTLIQVMALKDITTQNPERAPKNLEFVKKRHL